MVLGYRHLVLSDRIEIERLLAEGVSLAGVARRLGVHRSTVSREVRRRSFRPDRVHANVRPYLRRRLDTRPWSNTVYVAERAQGHAVVQKARSHVPYRMTYDRLVDTVIGLLRQGWTPEEIAGRLPIDFPTDPRMRVSHETLYSWVYSPEQSHRALWQYLPRGQKKRRKRHGRRVHSDRLKWRVSIHDRPTVITERVTFGHWESDSVIGAGHSGAIHTTVERQSRFVMATKLDHPTAAATLRAQQALYGRLPAHAVASITADNGPEFAHHYRLADLIGVPTYFCDPYCAWQRGTNEHFNGRLRRYIPKKTRFDTFTQEELDAWIHEINNRPRKVLNWATPAEVFQQLCSQPQTPNCCTSN